MNKRHLHHILVRLRKIRPWYFVIAIAISFTVFVVAYRHNSVVALQLRNNVLTVDQQNGDVEAALKTLREHVYGHMNSYLSQPGGAYPPVQLKYRYDRIVADQKSKAPSNASLATEAQNYCEAQIPAGRSLYRIDCIQNYILTHGSTVATNVPDALYKFDFSPPLWSPDLAGWSLVVTAVLSLAFIARSTAVFILKRSIDHN